MANASDDDERLQHQRKRARVGSDEAASDEEQEMDEIAEPISFEPRIWDRDADGCAHLLFRLPATLNNDRL